MFRDGNDDDGDDDDDDDGGGGGGGLVGALQKKPLARQDDILRNSELINSHLEDIPELETKAVQEASENLSRSNLESESRAQRSKVCG